MSYLSQECKVSLTFLGYDTTQFLICKELISQYKNNLNCCWYTNIYFTFPILIQDCNNIQDMCSIIF